ncbi:MAG TPA: transglutaminase domain-containing protein [Candidatus Saccharimonadales bacterium]|nr:transglutaminase domain-containing protein [Candidatus Saccharimonadales bacterium]
MRLTTPGRAMLVAVFLLAGAASAAAKEESGESGFPPVPDVSALPAATEAEREAGAVILERVVQLDGDVKVRPSSTKGWTRRRNRVRYLVLDAKGVEMLTRHSFFGEIGTGTELIEIRGRTVTSGGEEFVLDPKKDIRELDLKDSRGRTRKAGRTAFFPHVEPGAILDLIWTERSDQLPSFEIVPIQDEIPTRSLKVESQGLLLGTSIGKSMLLGGPSQQVYWVPFFVGPPPPRATATLDTDFNLDLEVSQIDAAPEEPSEPPLMRTRFVLGFLPEGFALTKKRSLEDWHRNLVLFGSPEATRIEMEKTSITRDLDPDIAMVRIDDQGLQEVPGWASSKELMGFFDRGLRSNHADIIKFLSSSAGAETGEAASAIAPADLSWRDRARKLYEHARSRVVPDPTAKDGKSLSKVLKEGRGSRLDVSLYYVHLLRECGIPARVLLAVSRYGIPFQPVIDSWGPFTVGWLVEASPPGEEPLYLFPGDPYANFATFDDHYLGALAFRQPDGKDDRWPMVRLPEDLPVSETMKIDFSATVPGGTEPADLTMRTTAIDSAARWLRWRFGWWTSPGEKGEAARTKRAKETLEGWLDTWAGLDLDGEPPAPDAMKDVEGPFSFEIHAPWSPEVQEIGDRLLVPALPKSAVFSNEFVRPGRKNPMWLAGGTLEVSLTWRMPEGWSLPQTPPRAERTGPAGLAYTMEIVQEPPAAGGGGGSVTTRVVLTSPRVLPATEYPGVKEFFEELQKTAAVKLLMSRSPTEGAGE